MDLFRSELQGAMALTYRNIPHFCLLSSWYNARDSALVTVNQL